MSDTKEILEENTESKNKWIDNVEKLSDEEKREIFKNLTRYARSDEFSELKKWCDKNSENITKEVELEIKSRLETKATKSKLDLYMILANTAEEISEKVNNIYLKSYLVDSYAKALSSSAKYKVEEGFDFPTFTVADWLKNKGSVYSSLQHYIDTCISYYDVETKFMKQKKEKEDENKYQPYN